MINKIKWAWQRVVRGWDDTAMWQLDSHFIDVVIPPLKQFLHNKFLDDGCGIPDENKERYEIYFKTFELIKAYERAEDWTQDDWSFQKEDTALKALVMYFAENIGWYWD